MTTTVEDTTPEVENAQEKSTPKTSSPGWGSGFKLSFTLPKKKPVEAADVTAQLTTLSSTTHSRWISRGVGALLIGALACGPVALVVTALKDPAPASVAQGVDASTVSASDKASGTAIQATRAWLTATAGDTGALATYFSNPVDSGFTTDAGKLPTIIDLAPVAVQPLTDTTWSVTVAAELEQPQASDELPESTTQYFELPIAVTGTSAIATRAPAMVAAPAPAKVTAPKYLEEVPATHPIYATAEQLLGALLTGSGDLSRLTSPHTVLQAVSPAPYTEVELVSVAAQDEATDSPTTGDTARVRLTGTGTTADGAQVPLQYTLALTARDGRWEISALNPAEPLPGEAPTQTSSEEPTTAAPAAPTEGTN